MKSIIKSCLVVLVLVVMLVCAFACRDNPASTDYEITFIVDGAEYAKITTAGNERLTIPVDPEKEGYIFEGWYFDNNIWVTPFSADAFLNAAVSNNIVIYAKFRKGHTHQYADIVVAPTCTEQGYTIHQCTCGDKYMDTYVRAYGHSWGEYVSNNDATCSADGTKTARCSRCPATDTITDEGTKLDHSYSLNRVVAPTCTEQGYTIHQCVCGEQYTDTYVSAYGHAWGEYVSNNDATCSADGTKTARCSRCPATDTITDEGTKLDHSYASAWTSDDTYHWHAATCVHTDKTKDKAEHDWSNGFITTQPTVDTEGVRTFFCFVCGRSKSQVVEKLDSSHVHAFTQQVVFERFLKQAATCTEKALYYYSCECGEVGTDTFEYGEALGHSYTEEWVYNDDFHYHAMNCGCEKLEGMQDTIIDVSEHSFDANHTCECGFTERFLVVFENDNGTVLDSQRIEYGKAAVAPLSPSKGEKYQFHGWDKDYSNVTSDLTVTATYIRLFEVTFVDYDGSVIAVELVPEGSTQAVNKPTPSRSREGYDFVGWDGYVLQSGDEYVETDIKNVAEDMTITAVYALHRYNVTFRMPNGTEIETQKVVHGGSAVTPAARPQYYFNETKRAAFTFTRWEGEMNDVRQDMTIVGIYDTNVEKPVISLCLKRANSWDPYDIYIKMYITLPQGNDLFALSTRIEWSSSEFSVNAIETNNNCPLGNINVGENVSFKDKNGGGYCSFNNKNKTIELSWFHTSEIKKSLANIIVAIEFNEGDADVGQDAFSIAESSAVLYGEDDSDVQGLKQQIPDICVVVG